MLFFYLECPPSHPTRLISKTTSSEGFSQFPIPSKPCCTTPTLGGVNPLSLDAPKLLLRLSFQVYFSVLYLCYIGPGKDYRDWNHLLVTSLPPARSRSSVKLAEWFNERIPDRLHLIWVQLSFHLKPSARFFWEPWKGISPPNKLLSWQCSWSSGVEWIWLAGHLQTENSCDGWARDGHQTHGLYKPVFLQKQSRARVT